MTQSGAGTNQVKTETLPGRIRVLFEELQLAIGWSRPSILLATYRSALTLVEAQFSLEKKIQKTSQSVYHLRVSADNFDVPLNLVQYPERETTVFFVTGLTQVGSDIGTRALRTLNIRRELLVDYKIRAVFWLSEQEAELLPAEAPDFWSFRHRMIDFLDKPTPKRISTLVKALNWPLWEYDELSRDTNSKISIRKELLRLIPSSWANESNLKCELYNMLASLYWAKGDYTSSIKMLKPGLEIAQKLDDNLIQSRYWVGLGMVLQSLNRIRESKNAFLTSIKLHPRSADGWSKLGIVYRQEGLVEEAISSNKKAIELNPNLAVSWINLGDLYSAENKPEEALLAYKQSVKIRSKNVYIWQRLGYLYKLKVNSYQAMQAFKKATELDNSNAENWLQLGICYSDLKKINSAVRAFYKAARRNPSDAAPWRRLGELYRTNGKLESARKAYKTAIILDPGDPTLLSLLNSCYPQKKTKS